MADVNPKTLVKLDNPTIAKLAIAIAMAQKFVSVDNEVIGPLARRVVETLDDLDNRVPHFPKS